MEAALIVDGDGPTIEPDDLTVEDPRAIMGCNAVDAYSVPR